jgi:hypothetical protein
MKQLLLLALLISLPLHAVARLGETETELVKRFGPPTGTSKHSIIAQGKMIALGPTMDFRQDDWSIQCDLIDSRCVRINYHKRGEWSEDQIQLVLNSNGQGATWTETSKSSMKKLHRAWRRADGSTATWQMGSMSLVWDAYNKAKARAEERAKNEAKQKPKI